MCNIQLHTTIYHSPKNTGCTEYQPLQSESVHGLTNRLSSYILDSATRHETICCPLRANWIVQLGIRSSKPISKEISTMIHMLHLGQHIIKSVSTHMDVMPGSQNVRTVHQMLAQRSPVEPLAIVPNLIKVFHMSRHGLIKVIDKRLASIERLKLLRIVMRTFLVKPACRQWIVLAAQGLGFRCGVAAGASPSGSCWETLSLAMPCS